MVSEVCCKRCQGFEFCSSVFMCEGQLKTVVCFFCCFCSLSSDLTDFIETEDLDTFRLHDLEHTLVSFNRTKLENFQGSPLSQATYNIKTEKKNPQKDMLMDLMFLRS